VNRLALYLFVCIAFSALSHTAQRKIVYEQGENVFVADVDGKHAKKIAAGALPEISPDGARVAFNTEGDAKNRPGPERHIAIADVKTGKITVLPNIPSDNCFGPVWSPDGKQLAFSSEGNENQPSIYRMSLDGKNRKLLVKHPRTPTASAP
jgi:TolB protein